MMHFKSFAADYWKAFAAGFGWVLLMATCYLVPDSTTYFYALLWAGAGTVASGVFVLGYLRYSKPTKDPVTRKRDWEQVWVWLLAQAAVLLLTVGLNFALRVININSAVFTADRVMQYRFTAAVFVTVFLEQAWLTWMWARQQVLSRRLLRRD